MFIPVLKIILPLIISSSIKSVRSIQINFIKVPGAVRNNSGSTVTLECNYSVRPDDTELVVKWFLNDDVVYQWIPPQKPQSLGILKDRLDLEYRATDDPRTVYRAMKIINPTTEMAGEYKCFVSTFADEDFSTKNMIIFEPEASLMIWQDNPKGGNVNFTCLGMQSYPAPKLIMYKDPKDRLPDKKPLQILQWNTSRHPNGRFSTYIIANTAVENLLPGTLIHCELRIPGTGYVKRKSLLYYPSGLGRGQGVSFKQQGIRLLKYAGILACVLVGSWSFISS